jgi:P27 family predicted phage terminase small subunit
MDLSKGGETMQRAKPVNLKSGKLTNEQARKRKEAEAKLKGDESISKEPPESLCDKGQDVYRRILEAFPESFLNSNDVFIVTTVADAIAQMDKLREQINELGPIASSESKLVITYQKYADILKKFSPELGLSPQARSQLAHLVAKEKETEQDPLLKVLNGKK